MDRHQASRVLAVLGLAAWLTVFVPVSASAKCNPGRTSDNTPYADGWDQYPGSRIGGLYSSILNYSPWVAPYWAGNLRNTVSGSIQLSDAYGDAWMIGWEEFYQGSRDTFICWAQADPFGGFDEECKTKAAQPTGSFTQYKILFDNKPSSFTFFMNNSLADTEGDFGQVPTGSAVFGEIYTISDQMPGGYNATEQFGSTYWWWPSYWQAYNGNLFNSSDYYFGKNKASSTFASIWDWWCAT